jgi:NADPH:quinone reductase-like Zn-dependent oxidoreductase
MRTVAACSPFVPLLMPSNPSLASVSIDGQPVTFGLIPAREPDFNARLPENSCRVLLRVLAFSCNYRDKGNIYQMLALARAGQRPLAHFALGSEFVAEVLAAGEAVTDLRPGDRVISDHHYVDGRRHSEYREGVPTEHGSRECLVLHRSKVIRIPANMPNEVAAAFGLNAQTAYSVARKLDVGPGANVLVTSAKSNTSLFVIRRLRARDVNVYVTTTAANHDAQFRALGVRAVFHLDRAAPDLAGQAQLQETARALGGFDGVFDPFLNLHIDGAVDVMRPGGRYVTCGWERHPTTSGAARAAPSYARVLETAVARNLHLIGNCLGVTSDLQGALDDHAAGRYPVVLDSVWTGGAEVGRFFERTYAAPDRFGKVVYCYG